MLYISKKLVFLLISLLIVVILIELSIYIVLSKQLTTAQVITRSICRNYNSSIKSENPTTETGGQQNAIHPDVLKKLMSYKYDERNNMVIKNELYTEIVDIKYDGIVNENFNAPFGIMVVLNDNSRGWIYFPEFMLAKTQFYVTQEGIDTPISKNDLAIGDEIKIVEEYNPYYPPTAPEQVISNAIYKLQN